MPEPPFNGADPASGCGGLEKYFSHIVPDQDVQYREQFKPRQEFETNQQVHVYQSREDIRKQEGKEGTPVWAADFSLPYHKFLPVFSGVTFVMSKHCS